MNRRIRTILYNDQRFWNTEIEILHTPIFQRMYGLKQLGFTDKIFVDSSHSRFSHVLGVLEQSSNIQKAIVDNLSNGLAQKEPYKFGSENQLISVDELKLHLQRKHKALRLMGLFHDITHGPFGHTLEDEIQLFTQKHDEPKRQAEAFWEFFHQFLSWTFINHYKDLSEIENDSNKKTVTLLRACPRTG